MEGERVDRLGEATEIAEVQHEPRGLLHFGKGSCSRATPAPTTEKSAASAHPSPTCTTSPA